MQTLQKIPEKPETIANLNITWTFDRNRYQYFTDFFSEFQNLNPNLEDYKIVPNQYNFIFNRNHDFKLKNHSFEINMFPDDRLTHLIFFIHDKLRLIFQKENIKSFDLLRFIKIEDTTFQIEEDLPF